VEADVERKADKIEHRQKGNLIEHKQLTQFTLDTKHLIVRRIECSCKRNIDHTLENLSFKTQYRKENAEEHRNVQNDMCTRITKYVTYPRRLTTAT
jgi:hypothetical protein